MMIFDIRPTLPDDFEKISNDIVQDSVGDLSYFSRFLPLFNESFTALVDGEICGIGGFVIFWQGVAECFSIWTKKCAVRHKISMVRGTRNVINGFCERHKIWRLQATIGNNIPKTWLEHIGFQYEGTMRNYSIACKDVDMYSKIYSENLRA